MQPGFLVIPLAGEPEIRIPGGYPRINPAKGMIITLPDNPAVSVQEQLRRAEMIVEVVKGGRGAVQHEQKIDLLQNGNLGIGPA